MLAKYVHGAPLSASAWTAIPKAKRCFLPLASAARRLARVVRPRALSAELATRSDILFDWLMARQNFGTAYDVVIGYEVGSAFIASAAKRAGLAFVLDAASVHHDFQDSQVARTTRAAFHAAVCARKDRELAAADLILTCSQLAAGTFIAAGLPASKIVAVPLGVDTKLASIGSAATPTGLPRLLFVGRLSRHKGFDVVLKAVTALVASGKQLELSIVTDLATADPVLLEELRRTSPARGIRCIPTMPQAELLDVFRNHDALLLASRFDSFGLVVAEALAAGCPVIVGPNVGASSLIDNGLTGIRLQHGSADELTAALADFTEGIDTWRARRAIIRRSAERLDWHHYRAAVADRIQAFMAGRTR